MISVKKNNTLISEQLSQHLQTPDIDKENDDYRTPKSYFTLQLEVTKCKKTTNYNSCFTVVQSFYRITQFQIRQVSFLSFPTTTT